MHSVSGYGTSGRIAPCVSASTSCATSTPAAPDGRDARPLRPPFRVRLSASTSRAGGVSTAKAGRRASGTARPNSAPARGRCACTRSAGRSRSRGRRWRAHRQKRALAAAVMHDQFYQDPVSKDLRPAELMNARTQIGPPALWRQPRRRRRQTPAAGACCRAEEREDRQPAARPVRVARMASPAPIITQGRKTMAPLHAARTAISPRPRGADEDEAASASLPMPERWSRRAPRAWQPCNAPAPRDGPRGWWRRRAQRRAKRRWPRRRRRQQPPVPRPRRSCRRRRVESVGRLENAIRSGWRAGAHDGAAGEKRLDDTAPRKPVPPKMVMVSLIGITQRSDTGAVPLAA